MAQGDRVVVGTGYVWEAKNQQGEKEFVMVYAPVLKENNQLQVTPDGGIVVERQGGVLAGSTGTIKGEAINVHRSYLHNRKDYPTGLGGTDFIKMVPVFLDYYQKLGWFPVDNIRIFGGSPAR